LKKVFLYGYFCDNLGDDLFVRHICTLYPDVEFHIVIEGDFGQAFASIENLIIHRFSFFDRIFDKLFKRWFFRERIAKTCDTIVHIGGSVFIQGNNWADKFKNYKRLFNSCKKKFIVGANFGPYTDINYLNSYKEFFSEFDGICFRDKYSYKLFSDLEQVNYAPDILFSYGFDFYKKKSSEKTVAFSVMNKGEIYLNKIAQLADDFVEKGYRIILIGFSRFEGDLIAVNKVEELMEHTCEKHMYSSDIDDTLSILAKADLIFATRFHSMVLGWGFEKKVYPCIYSNKMLTVIEDLHPEQKYCTLENIKQLSIDEIFEGSFPTDISEIKVKSKTHFETIGGILNE